MILFYAILFNGLQAILEALFKKYVKKLSAFIEDYHVCFVFFLFVAWFVIALNFQGYYVPAWKLIAGFVFVRFLIFDFLWNLTMILTGSKISIWYVGDGLVKYYDKVMIYLRGFGWFAKLVLGIVGICFLMGWA